MEACAMSRTATPGMTRRLAGRANMAAALLAATFMAGCAAPKPMYEWNGYQASVYAHFKGQSGSPEQQIIDLEKGLELAKAHGTTPPPGYHAHLGLLYMTVGKNDLAAQSWNTEKALFPESSRYMDFLLNNMKKQGA
jgi:hypothetical protein